MGAEHSTFGHWVDEDKIGLFPWQTDGDRTPQTQRQSFDFASMMSLTTKPQSSYMDLQFFYLQVQLWREVLVSYSRGKQQDWGSGELMPRFSRFFVSGRMLFLLIPWS